MGIKDERRERRERKVGTLGFGQAHGISGLPPAGLLGDAEINALAYSLAHVQFICDRPLRTVTEVPWDAHQ